MPALFIPATELNLPSSVEIANDTLPTRIPTLIDTLPLPPTLPPAIHSTPVSEPHNVSSATLRPIRDHPLVPRIPYPAPYSVSDSDPLLAVLPRPSPLIGKACQDSASDKLPIRPPALICIRRLPPAPPPTSPRTELSDSHVVPSLPVSPPRPRPLLAHSPTLAPTIVTLTDPVPAVFPPAMPLAQLASTE